MSSRFVLGRENVPCVAEVVNRSLKADCTDFTNTFQRAILYQNEGHLILYPGDMIILSVE